MNNSLLRGTPAAGRLALVKEIYDRKGVLRTNDGIEVSIPNIIVAVSVSVAIIIAVIVGVVWIVPWTQDNNAQSQVSSIQSAEQLYFAQNNVYGSNAQLTAPTGGQAKPVLVDSGAGNFSAMGNATYYCIEVKSNTNTHYWADSTSTKISSSATVPAAMSGAGCTLSVIP